MKISKLYKCTLSALICLLALTACEEQTFSDDPKLSPEDFTHLNVYLTDSPTEAEEINIEITSVKIMTDNNEKSFRIATYSDIFNLLSLTNGKTALLAEADLLESKTIEQFELVLGNRNTIVVDGIVYPLQASEDIESRLKIHCNIPLSEVLIKNVTIDFDAEKSIINEGNGIYMLQPHLRITD